MKFFILAYYLFIVYCLSISIIYAQEINEEDYLIKELGEVGVINVGNLLVNKEDEYKFLSLLLKTKGYYSPEKCIEFIIDGKNVGEDEEDEFDIDKILKKMKKRRGEEDLITNAGTPYIIRGLRSIIESKAFHIWKPNYLQAKIKTIFNSLEIEHFNEVDNNSEEDIVVDDDDRNHNVFFYYSKQKPMYKLELWKQPYTINKELDSKTFFQMLEENGESESGDGRKEEHKAIYYSTTLENALQGLKEFREGENIHEYSLVKDVKNLHPLVTKYPLYRENFDYSSFGEIPGNVVNSNIWIGSKNVTSRLHFDGSDNFFVQLYGSKSFILIDPKFHLNYEIYPFSHPASRQSKIPFEEFLHFDHQEYNIEEENNNSDTIDNQGENDKKKKREKDSLKAYLKIPTQDLKERYQLLNEDALNAVSHANLRRGDLLFIPSCWLHHVQSISTSISSSILVQALEKEVVRSIFLSPVSSLYSQYNSLSLSEKQAGTIFYLNQLISNLEILCTTDQKKDISSLKTSICFNSSPHFMKTFLYSRYYTLKHNDDLLDDSFNRYVNFNNYLDDSQTSFSSSGYNPFSYPYNYDFSSSNQHSGINHNHSTEQDEYISNYNQSNQQKIDIECSQSVLSSELKQKIKSDLEEIISLFLSLPTEIRFLVFEDYIEFISSRVVPVHQIFSFLHQCFN